MKTASRCLPRGSRDDDVLALCPRCLPAQGLPVPCDLGSVGPSLASFKCPEPTGLTPRACTMTGQAGLMTSRPWDGRDSITN